MNCPRHNHGYKPFLWLTQAAIYPFRIVSLEAGLSPMANDIFISFHNTALPTLEKVSKIV